MDNINLKRKVSLKRKFNAVNYEEQNKKSKRPILVVIFVLVLIGGFIGLIQKKENKSSEAFDKKFFGSEEENTNPGDITNEILSSLDNQNTIENDNLIKSEVSFSESKNNTPSSDDNFEVKKIFKYEGSSDLKNIKSKEKLNLIENQSGKSTVQNNVEEKAKQVIRGDFGNGKERKLALGPEYGVIQAKVNEMYRYGLNE